MKFRIRELCQDLSVFDTIYLYGIGMYAKEIYSRFCSIGWREKIKGFIVSEEMEVRYFDDIPVLSVGQFKVDRCEKYIILVSVSCKYVEEIKENLRKYGITNEMYLKDYIRQWEDGVAIYKNKTFEEYCNCISDWYLEQNYMGASCNYNFLNEVIECRKLKRNEKEIIFIIGQEMSLPRNIKIMTALINSGYEVSVLTYAGVNELIVQEEIKTYEINIKECECIEELMYEMLRYNPLVYYIEPAWGDCTWPAILVQHKEMFGKIVMTLYDIFNDGLVRATERQKLLEQYSLENADGIVWRWFAKESLEKKGMRFKGKSIQFIDYCGCSLADLKQEEKDDSNQIKFCYVRGNPNEVFGTLPDEAEHYDVNAKMKDILAKILKDNSCYLHMYAWDLRDEYKKECEMLEKKYRNFKVYWKLGHKEMMEKIKDYDYGIQLSTGGEEIPDYVTVDNRYYGIAFKDSVGNKVFDYLEAGIPIITTMPKKLCSYLDDYHVMVKMDLSNFDIEYLRKNKKYYMDNVKKAREELSIKNHIGRLVQFFREVGKS